MNHPVAGFATFAPVVVASDVLDNSRDDKRMVLGRCIVRDEKPGCKLLAIQEQGYREVWVPDTMLTVDGEINRKGLFPTAVCMVPQWWATVKGLTKFEITAEMKFGREFRKAATRRRRLG